MMRGTLRQQGFGLIEAMTATAFTGIALAGAFSLAATSRASLQQSQMRSELMMVSDDIFEHLSADRDAIDSYTMDVGISAEQCAALASDTDTSAKAYRYTLCQRLEAIAPYRSGDIRTITITSTTDGIRHANIILQGRVGNAALPVESVAVRAFDIPGG